MGRSSNIKYYCFQTESYVRLKPRLNPVLLATPEALLLTLIEALKDLKPEMLTASTP